ncbi:hypothetical protein L596_001700 [Steinernema carpocapsae]|uniref:Major facilitator superfamily (MFS) profile domain-containing protein n=1 Tax=Steinernema carpocapsae TaxID=34508 RepID=A0A4U8UPN5_STECR|nr:hypothetical protein L596_001700 [Steinernema carpocapsae]
MITIPLINRTSDGTSAAEEEEALATIKLDDDQRRRRRLSEEVIIVMSDRKTRIRRRLSRSRRDGVADGGGAAMPHTGEDLMAVEPQLDSASGPHMPLIFRASRKDDDYARIRDESPVDQTLSWFARSRKNLKGDFSSICLLLFLYLLQGIPLGLIAAIPLILQDKHVSYKEQAVFSFAYWPFSMKLLWAPIVDSIYWKKLGRRKSWMVPCQYLIGIFMLVLSYQVPNILGSEQDHTPVNVFFLMSVFLPLNFLAATQDIAVDGWALTMLSRKNVGYASTCNAVGQTAGFFIGNVVFLTLESENFANKFIRSTPGKKGLVDLAGFVFFWGWVFIITTTLVLIFKKEVDHSQTPESKEENGEAGSGSEEDEMELGIFDTYLVLLKIFKLKPMFWMVVVLLTGKFAFAATDGINGLKLIEMGIPKDTLASLSVYLIPVQILLPWFIGKYTSGPRPLNVFLWAYPYRIFVTGVFAGLLFYTPSFRLDSGEYPFSLYALWVAAFCLYQIASYCMFVSMMAFNAQISDPKIGGTYMTLLNTLNNLGGNWPVTLVLSITDKLTWKNCIAKGTSAILHTCNTKEDADTCAAGGDVCEMHIDGYYLGVAICAAVGFLWYKLMFSKIKHFQKIPRKEWSVFKK